MKTPQMTIGEAGAPARPSRFERHLAKHFDKGRAGADMIVRFDHAA